MRKPLVYRVSGIAVVVVVVLGALVIALGRHVDWVGNPLDDYVDGSQYGGLTISYPLDETLFPPEVAAPTVRWRDSHADSDIWLVTIKFADDEGRMSFRTHQTEWTPSDADWEAIKRRSLEKPARVAILGVNRAAPRRILSGASISISTSKDEVGASLFFREVHLPFIKAATDPARFNTWRFGDVSSKKLPPAVMDNLPVCANCHSFTADGSTLAMDVDYANDKGSYIIAPIEEQMVFDKAKIISWNDYKPGERLTFGLLAQISPDGKYVVCTVRDHSIFVPTVGIEFSQLFFPIKGILCYYDRKTEKFHTLPGADDIDFVQSNPSWSPDGKYIVFVRAKAYQLKNDFLDPNTPLLSPDECREFLDGSEIFQYDLYRIPFNDGKGGKAEPLEGASNNGMSNYFAKYSPDGKWIIFCKARAFMMLQPDSELYIMPAEGGEARKLRCNTSRMNSWHSWSPNSKWLVFSSKAYGIMTQLLLTHIDEQGRSTPAVYLSRMTSSDKAVNIPEFVNAKSDAIKKIREQFIDDQYYQRAGSISLTVHEPDLPVAEEHFRKSLELNPKNWKSRFGLAEVMRRKGLFEESKAQLLRGIEYQPDNADFHLTLGELLSTHLESEEEAITHFREAVRIDPEFFRAYFNLGMCLLKVDKVDEALEQLSNALRLKPDDPRVNCRLGIALDRQKKFSQAAACYARALEHEPTLVPAILGLASIFAKAKDPKLHHPEEAVQLARTACELSGYKDLAALKVLEEVYAELGRFPEAAQIAESAVRIIRSAGDEKLADTIEKKIEVYQQQKPFRRSDSP